MHCKAIVEFYRKEKESINTAKERAMGLKLFFLVVVLGFGSGLCASKADTLLFEPHLQSILLRQFLEMGSICLSWP
jgi:hypothetical protein